MLQSISWAGFKKVVSAAVLVYYVWVVRRYYWRRIKCFLSGRKRESETAPAKAGSGSGVVKMDDGGKPAVAELDGAGQGTLFEIENGVKGDSPELFKVMEKVVGLLKSLVAVAVSEGINHQDLTDRIRMVLSGYHHLKGTPYQVAINNFLVRTCSSNFSLVLDEEWLEWLWD